MFLILLDNYLAFSCLCYPMLLFYVTTHIITKNGRCVLLNIIFLLIEYNTGFVFSKAHDFSNIVEELFIIVGSKKIHCKAIFVLQ